MEEEEEEEKEEEEEERKARKSIFIYEPGGQISAEGGRWDRDGRTDGDGWADERMSG